MTTIKRVESYQVFFLVVNFEQTKPISLSRSFQNPTRLVSKSNHIDRDMY